jgi:hypothetical protein
MMLGVLGLTVSGYAMQEICFLRDERLEHLH